MLLFLHFVGLAFEFCLFFLFRLAADVNGGDHKSTLLDGEVEKLGRLPPKLLQAKVCVVRIWVTVRD